MTVFGAFIPYNLFWTLALMVGGIIVMWIGFVFTRISKTLTWIAYILEDLLLVIGGAEDHDEAKSDQIKN